MRNNFQFSRGNLVFSDDNGDAVYEDGTPFDDTRPCVVCKVSVGPDDPDPCLGWLDGVDSSCCGHGIPGEEYVLANGVLFDTVEEWRATISTTSQRQEDS